MLRATSAALSLRSLDGRDQIHITDLGFYGNARTVEGRTVAYYRVLLGGHTTLGQATFGEPVAALPAKRIPEALKALLIHYRDSHQNGEPFHSFVQRLGVAHFKKLLEPFACLPSYQERPDLYNDLGMEGEFKLRLGKGECAA